MPEQSNVLSLEDPRLQLLQVIWRIVLLFMGKTRRIVHEFAHVTLIYPCAFDRNFVSQVSGW